MNWSNLFLCLFLMEASAVTIAQAAAREPWTSSRLTGSPNPPLPYATEPAFPKLKFTNPVELVPMPGTDRVVVVELAGRIVSFSSKADTEKTDLFADLKEIPGMRQAYGLAFHPGFVTNRQVFVCYVIDDKHPEGTRVSRFKMRDSNPPQLDLPSEQILLTWLSGGHNGGCLQFGNDGCLYISAGDAAAPTPPDSLDTGQDLDDLLCCVLRIDVDHPSPGKPYRVPPDNPFVTIPGARPEIWAYGFRNPWKMSFDRATGELWVGDVGWELWEMIYRVQRGGNYGWSAVEGPQSVRPHSRRGPTPILPPAAAHSHTESRSITGGYVYRGKKFHELRGTYIYGDYVTGKIWGLRSSNGKVTWKEEIADSTHNIICFGEDSQGEFYVVDYAGTLHQLSKNHDASHNPKFPTRLSETGLFASTRDHRTAPGVIPYSVQVELWQDHATAERFVGIPGSARLSTFARNNLQAGQIKGNWDFPIDTVFARTVSLELERGNPASKRRLETQILHRHESGWQAYNYLWNEAQSDATLAGAEASEKTFEIKDPTAPGSLHRQTWRFASRGECNLCHVTRAGSILGFIPPQLDCSTASGTRQLKDFEQMGLIDRPVKLNPLPALTNTTASLESRARAYLYVNCAHCHRQGGGGTANFDLKLETITANSRLFNEPPTQGSFGLTSPAIVAPGNPFSSVLLYRMAILGRGRMPHLGSTLVDVDGLRLLREWIGPTQTASKSADEWKTLLASPSGGLHLACALDDEKLSTSDRVQIASHALKTSSPEVRALFLRFLPDDQREAMTRTASRDEILALKGNASRGRELFFRENMQCINCHSLEGKGRAFGPDLRVIAGKSDRSQLLQSLMEPSAVIDPRFALHHVETKSGDVWSGFILNRDQDGLSLREASGRDIQLKSSQVERVDSSSLSAMPEMLLLGVSAQEVADLLSFLQGLQ